MKRKFLYTCFSLVMILAVALLIVPFQAFSACNCCEECLGDGACFAIAVGRKASADGSTFFSHNED